MYIGYVYTYMLYIYTPYIYNIYIYIYIYINKLNQYILKPYESHNRKMKSKIQSQFINFHLTIRCIQFSRRIRLFSLKV